MNAVRKVLSVLVGLVGVLAALATFVGLWVWAIARFVDEVQQHPVSGLVIAWCVVVAFGASLVAYLVAALFLSIAHALWPNSLRQARRRRRKMARQRNSYRASPGGVSADHPVWRGRGR